MDPQLFASSQSPWTKTTGGRPDALAASMSASSDPVIGTVAT